MSQKKSKSDAYQYAKSVMPNNGDVPGLQDKKTGRFVKGNAGKPKGTLNHDIAFIRQAFADIMMDGKDKIITLIERVAVDDPYKAVQLYLKLAEFIMPKLQQVSLDMPTSPIVFQLPTFATPPSGNDATLNIDNIQTAEELPSEDIQVETPID